MKIPPAILSLLSLLSLAAPAVDITGLVFDGLS
jgi:hypothetical protein